MKKTCPDTEMIGDYLEGNLSEKDRLRLQKHFSECEHCLDRVMVVNDLMHHEADVALEAVPGRTTEAARRLVAEQNRGAAERLTEKISETVKGLTEKASDFFEFVPWGTAQLQAVRDKKEDISKDLVFLHKTLTGRDVRIEIERTRPGLCDIQLIFGEDADAGRGIRVDLKEGGREMASSLSEGEAILFESIPFGRYHLTFTKDGSGFGTMDLEIAEKGCGTR